MSLRRLWLRHVLIYVVAPDLLRNNKWVDDENRLHNKRKSVDWLVVDMCECGSYHKIRRCGFLALLLCHCYFRILFVAFPPRSIFLMKHRNSWHRTVLSRLVGGFLSLCGSWKKCSLSDYLINVIILILVVNTNLLFTINLREFITPDPVALLRVPGRVFLRWAAEFAEGY